MKRKIKIGRRQYKVKQVNHIKPLHRKSKGVTVGMIKPNKKEILIKRVGKIIDKQTLFHELAHGMMVELIDGACRGNKKAKSKRNKARFLSYANMFCKLNTDEGFIEYFGGLLNKTFKLK
jgi:hypothetical protein